MNKKNIYEELDKEFPKDDKDAIYTSEILLNLVIKLIKLFGKGQFYAMMETIIMRYSIIETLEKIIDDKETLEKQIEEILHKNPWILNDGYETLVKEISYKKLMRKFGKPLDKCLKKDKNKRLDLFCKIDSKTVVIIELKRPRYKIKEDALCQLMRYRYIIKDKFKKEKIYSYLICGTFDKCLDQMIPELEQLNIYLLTYDNMLSKARDRYYQILGNIKAKEDLNKD